MPAAQKYDTSGCISGKTNSLMWWGMGRLRKESCRTENEASLLEGPGYGMKSGFILGDNGEP